MSAAPVYEDVARFGPYEANDVVAASFACPYCLTQPATVAIDLVDVLAVAVCHCVPCDADFHVHLRDDQALRIALAPPPQLARPSRR